MILREVERDACHLPHLGLRGFSENEWMRGSVLSCLW